MLVSLRTPATEESLARDEEMLVDQATRLRFDDFVRATTYWSQLADPDGADADAADRRARRDAYLARSLDGMWLGSMTLDPVSGSIVSTELERLEKILFESDWTQAAEVLGRDPRPSELERSPAQRRADALVEMATRSKTQPADGRRPAPLFTVLVGWETLNGRISELDDGTVLPPGSLLPMAGPGRPRTGGVRPRPEGGDQPHPAPVHRGHPPGHRDPRPRVHPPPL